jgi:dTDP-4-dehydrorhamnose reductase
MRLLQIGTTGQLGQELQRVLPSVGELITLGRESLDLAQPQQIPQRLQEIRPDVVINAAAYTAVDKAESEFELAKTINGIAPTVLAETAQQLGIALIHVSTDYVFNGQKNTPYLETDATQPLGAYGHSKLIGEVGIQNACENYYILRTAWVYGSRGHGNFVKTMLRLGKEREELRVVVDQIGTPTWSYDLAVAIARLIPTAMSSSAPGIYHCTNSGVTSWYDFAVAIFEEAQSCRFPLQVKRVVPISTVEYPTPAKRPAYSVLSGKKLATVLGDYPPQWRQSLRKMLQEWWEISHN